MESIDEGQEIAQDQTDEMETESTRQRYLATDVFLRELQVVCQVSAFSSGYFVQLPRDFRHFPESMEIIPVYTQFGDVEVLVGIELQVAVQ